MFTKKIFCGFILALLIICSFSAAQAEIKTYTGVGVHYMEDENETLDAAKDKAKELAYSDALEQASVNVQSYSEMHNCNLTRDEIITITAGILYPIGECKYSIEDEFGVILIKAEVTVKIDTDKIPELVEREIKRHAQN